MGTLKDRPAYNRAVALIDALNADAGPGRVLHGAFQVLLIGLANDLDSRAEEALQPPMVAGPPSSEGEGEGGRVSRVA